MMKSLVLILLLSICSMSAFCQDVEDTQENREIAAEHYLKVAPLETMMSDAVDKMALQLPEERRNEFKLFMEKYIRIDVVKDAVLHSMVKHFTTEELNALADFYGSPVGKSAMAKFGAYMADITPVIVAEMEHATSEFAAAKAGLHNK